jgi:hypothetical protein
MASLANQHSLQALISLPSLFHTPTVSCLPITMSFGMTKGKNHFPKSQIDPSTPLLQKVQWHLLSCVRSLKILLLTYKTPIILLPLCFQALASLTSYLNSLGLFVLDIVFLCTPLNTPICGIPIHLSGSRPSSTYKNSCLDFSSNYRENNIILLMGHKPTSPNFIVMCNLDVLSFLPIITGKAKINILCFFFFGILYPSWQNVLYIVIISNKLIKSQCKVYLFFLFPR